MQTGEAVTGLSVKPSVSCTTPTMACPRFVDYGKITGSCGQVKVTFSGHWLGTVDRVEPRKTESPVVDAGSIRNSVNEGIFGLHP